MALYFLDSSAVVKRYIHEIELGPLTGHTWMGTLCALAASGAHQLVISQLARVEVVSTFHKKARANAIKHVELDKILRDFAADCATDYAIWPVPEVAFNRATALIRTHGRTRDIRSLDAIQLTGCLDVRASALAAGGPSPIFVCADTKLLNVATLEGLATENPNLYP